MPSETNTQRHRSLVGRSDTSVLHHFNGALVSTMRVNLFMLYTVTVELNKTIVTIIIYIHHVYIVEEYRVFSLSDCLK